MTFLEKYENLERVFERQVAKDYAELGIKSVFLPNIRPEGPVDFVLIGQEPSCGNGNPDKAREVTDRVDRNFSGSLEDFILHFCVKKYLCKGGKTYYLTDLSKGAMKTGVADREREKRYEEWYPLLKRELRVVAKPGAQAISIGRTVQCFLERKAPDGCIIKRIPHYGGILHYSLQAAPHRGKASKCDPEGYRQFCSEVNLRDVEQAAKEVLAQAGMGESHINHNLNRLRAGCGLTDSRKMLMFDYKVAFGRINGATP